MDDTTRLEESLRNLRAEIDALDIGNEDARQRLDELVQGIERALEQPSRSGDESLGEQLKISILKFEVSHPRLALVMNDVVDSLGRMGI